MSEGAKIRVLIADDYEPTREERVLVLTTFGLDKSVYEAARAGASGFLLKAVPPRQLIAAVLDVANGDVLLAPEVTKRLVERFVSRPPPGTAAPPELAD